jgi:hypothetical protein
MKGLPPTRVTSTRVNSFEVVVRKRKGREKRGEEGGERRKAQ